jgi:hypothetical protein
MLVKAGLEIRLLAIEKRDILKLTDILSKFRRHNTKAMDGKLLVL